MALFYVMILRINNYFLTMILMVVWFGDTSLQLLYHLGL
jgi:hypothetical protein